MGHRIDLKLIEVQPETLKKFIRDWSHIWIFSQPGQTGPAPAHNIPTECHAVVFAMCDTPYGPKTVDTELLDVKDNPIDMLSPSLAETALIILADRAWDRHKVEMDSPQFIAPILKY